MGLTAGIFVTKEAGYENCSNGGISSKFKQVCIVNAEGPSEPQPDCPAVIIESHYRGIVRAIPAQLVQGEWRAVEMAHCVGPMMGGAYIATSDSRFGELVRRLIGGQFYGAVALHDRFESTEDYRSLSQ